MADHLVQGPRSAASLAEAVGADAQSLYRVLRLLASRDGSLWMIGGRGGMVIHIRNGRVATYSKGEGLPSALALGESSNGMLVAGTTDGLYRFAGGKWESADSAWGYPGEQARAERFARRTWRTRSSTERWSR